MEFPRKIILVGPMGAGKSTIGRHLGRALGYVFHDSDREIESRTGANIPWIFDVEGEPGFRKRETNMIAELLENEDIVLATGGGAVTVPETRAELGKGFVVYLRTPLSLQYERTRLDRNRPLLQHEDPYGVLERLFRERDPLYTEVADLVVSGDRKGPRALVRHIIDQIRRQVSSGETAERGSKEG